MGWGGLIFAGDGVVRFGSIWFAVVCCGLLWFVFGFGHKHNAKQPLPPYPLINSEPPSPHYPRNR